MQNEQKLKISYEEQLARFNASKEKKLKNLDEQLEKLKKKKDSVEHSIETLEQQIGEICVSHFRSFEDFLRTARENSLKATTENLSPSTSSTDSSES